MALQFQNRIRMEPLSIPGRGAGGNIGQVEGYKDELADRPRGIITTFNTEQPNMKPIRTRRNLPIGQPM